MLKTMKGTFCFRCSLRWDAFSYFEYWIIRINHYFIRKLRRHRKIKFERIILMLKALNETCFYSRHQINADELG